MSLMRFSTFTLLVLIVSSCSRKESSTPLNPQDSAFAAKLASQLAPNIKKGIYYCGTIALMQKEAEMRAWEETFPRSLICTNYIIKKKKFDRFIDILGKTDSFSITNFSYPYVFEDVENLVDTFPKETSVQDANQKDTALSIKLSPGDFKPMSFYFKQIFILKTGIQDSVPLSMQFSTYGKEITMTLCTDSIVSKKISKILIGQRLARRTVNS